MPKPEIDSLSLPPPIQELVRTAIAWNTILRNPKIARATVVQAQKDLEAAVAALPPIR
jgi:hypothetical protein